MPSLLFFETVSMSCRIGTPPDDDKDDPVCANATLASATATQAIPACPAIFMLASQTPMLAR